MEATGRYTQLPPPVRWEDMVPVTDAGPDPFERGEHDAEITWLLRTVGIG